VLAIAIAVLFVSAHHARELAALHEQFAASVSHELRTPLSVISSASDNLADGVVKNVDQMRQYGKMIRGNSEQLSEMIENAIWFARRDARAGLESPDVDVEELICTAVGTCSRTLQEAGVELERDIEPGLPPIRGNRTLLLHGLQNLLTNVASHGYSGKWARVSAKLMGGEVAFTVEDRGNGIPSDEVTHVFDPFYRGKRARQTGQAGLGLGLSLVKRVVQAHAGRVQLRPRRGQGAAIVFTVPVSKAHESN
jgi:signal transduction histidine kinase